jgi:uncharacterized membrane protein YkvA (DUF1232 family)
MTLTISFTLSDRDLEHFTERMAEIRAKNTSMSQDQILDAANRIVTQIRGSQLPDFVWERIDRLEQMAKMVPDIEWKLEAEDRTRILNALAYVVDPHDLIADNIPGIGFLDDALMVELVSRDLKHELEAYRDFCSYRADEERRLGKTADPVTRERWLSARRTQLHDRMRRRRSALWERRLGRRRPSSSARL